MSVVLNQDEHADVLELLEAAVSGNHALAQRAWQSLLHKDSRRSPYRLLQMISTGELTLSRHGHFYAATTARRLVERESAIIDRAEDSLELICTTLGVSRPMVILAFGVGGLFPMKSTEEGGAQCVWIPEAPDMQTVSVIAHELTHCVLQSGIALLDEGLAVHFQQRVGGSVTDIPTGPETPSNERPPSIRMLLQASRDGAAFHVSPSALPVRELYALASKLISLLESRIGSRQLAQFLITMRTVPRYARYEALAARIGLQPSDIDHELGVSTVDTDVDEGSMKALETCYGEAMATASGFHAFARMLDVVLNSAATNRLDAVQREIILRGLCFRIMVSLAQGMDVSRYQPALHRHRRAAAYLDGESCITKLAEAVETLAGGFRIHRFVDPVLVGLARRHFLAAISSDRGGDEAMLYLSALESWVPRDFSGSMACTEALERGGSELAKARACLLGLARP